MSEGDRVHVVDASDKVGFIEVKDAYIAGEIARCLGISRQAVSKRALKEGWRFRSVKSRKEYFFDSLPPDVWAMVNFYREGGEEVDDIG